jgi:hypothetical protein
MEFPSEIFILFQTLSVCLERFFKFPRKKENSLNFSQISILITVFKIQILTKTTLQKIMSRDAKHEKRDMKTLQIYLNTLISPYNL